MARRRGLRYRFLVFALLILPVAAPGQDEFAEVETLWNERQHDQAIDKILNPCIAQLDSLMAARDLTQDELTRFRRASLLLVQTRALYYDVLNGQDYRDRALQQISSAKLDIDKLLSVDALRHTHPDPQTMPTLGQQLFDQVRREKFGSFKVRRLDPPNALVVLQDDTLRAVPGELPSEADLLPGTYSVLVRHDGYRDYRENILVTVGEPTQGAYQLQKGRNWLWWTWRGSVVAVAATALTLGLTSEDGGGTAPPADLPPPPGPPSQ